MLWKWIFSQEMFPVRTWETALFLVGEKMSHSDFKGTVLLDSLDIQDVLCLHKNCEKKKFKSVIWGFFPVYARQSFCVFFHVDSKSRRDNFTTASISFSDSWVLVALLQVENTNKIPLGSGVPSIFW